MQYAVIRHLIILLGCLAVMSCGSTPPAPVVVLNSQPVEDEGFRGDTYTVKRGDTLYAVAWYTGNDYRDIARYNNLSAPYTIHPGEVLRLTAPTAPPVVKTAPAPRPKAPTGRTSIISEHFR